MRQLKIDDTIIAGLNEAEADALLALLTSQHPAFVRTVSTEVRPTTVAKGPIRIGDPLQRAKAIYRNDAYVTLELIFVGKTTEVK